MNRAIRWAETHVTLVCALLVFVAGLLVYGYAVNLPYRIDDFVHLRWLNERTLAEVWQSAAGLSYYRPMPFTVWKVVYWLSGGFPPQVLHGINVVCHALNGTLVFMLIRLCQRRTVGGSATAVVAALLFLMFPFSYQAIPWAGSLTHPLVTLFTLCALVLAVAASEVRSSLLRMASLCFTLAAPFTHETGVLVALLLTLLYVTMERGLKPRQVVARTWLHWGCTLLATGALLVLRGDVGGSSATLESRWQNGVYFLQGLAYPVAPLATKLMVLFPGLNDLGAILIVCVPALLLLVLLYMKLGQGRLALFALGWYGVAVAPAWLLLGFSYVVDGPRLMYEASVGAGALWSIPVAVVLTRWGEMRRWTVRLAGAIIAALVVLGTIAGSIGFLRERADMYEQTRLAGEGLLQGALQPAQDSRIMFSVNFPGWIAPKTPTFALGHEGVTFIPDYSSLIDLVWTMTGQDRLIGSIVLTELQSHWRYNYRNYGVEWRAPDLQPQLRVARKIFFTSYRNHDLVTYDAGNLEFGDTPRAKQYVAAYNEQLALLSGEWLIERRQGDALLVTLHWQSWQTVTQEVRTYVHLQNEAGELVAQEDGLPLMGIANPLWWKPGDQWRDVRVIELPPGVKPGQYTLRVGVYPAGSESRYAAVDPGGHRFENDSALLGTVDLP